MTRSAYAEMLGTVQREHVEEDLQRVIVQHLILTGSKDVIWYHCPNGEHRSKRTGGRLKAMGVRPGIPDLCFTLKSGQSAYLELKKPGGRLSKDQKAFADKCERMKFVYAIAYSLDEALAVLRGWEVLPD